MTSPCTFCEIPCSRCPVYNTHVIHIDSTNSFGWSLRGNKIKIMWSCGIDWTSFILGWLDNSFWHNQGQGKC
jgi:hypothetical protein